MSAQRARSAVGADHRSAHPNFPGVPGWGAVLIAITATTIGFAFDAGSGSKELSTVFAVCYVLGCLAAVLAVRQQAVFTAVIQPPLLLFVTVPGSYFLFTGGQFTGLKDLAINCGYPLIERFPLMFFTSAAVLLIGIGRWYIGMSTRRASPAASEDAEAPTPALASTVATAVTAIVAKIKSLLPSQHREQDDEAAAPPRRRRPQNAPKAARADRADRAAARTARAASTRSGRPTKRSAPSRSRHVRPPETELIEPVVERPRRPRSGRHAEPPPGPEPRRRPRTSNPRQPGPPPSERRAGYERRGLDRSADRVERRRRFDSYEPREPHGRNGVANGNGDYHPISRVRYRGEEADDRAEYRTRRRAPRGWEADSWEYDI
ncbi:DUF6542 domain-containing protein [Mycolicibacterium celeriflavum]|uniref:DUF6542 domain-containing protein n=1 Tax=Mycolicibacterium celeriflavum TaxID=1249101 RepID=UPI003CFB72C6